MQWRHLGVAYILGIVIVILFVYGCTATAYTYSYSTTLGIWLGVFLPFAVCCGLYGRGTAGEDFSNKGDDVVGPCFFSGSAFVGLLVGLIGGIYFLAPWWMMAHLGTAYNVDAAALDVINNRTNPTSGIFHFQPTAFVNQNRYG